MPAKTASRRKLVVTAAAVNRRLDHIQRSLDALVKHQRLSTILEFKGHGSELKVTPEKFEPDREVLLDRALKALNDPELSSRYQNGDPNTWGYCILEKCAFDDFVIRDTYTAVKKGLARLLANRDIRGAENFLREVMTQL
ncbi:hypothetical protein KW796_02295 [Candidatus Parcubacteria bacterium]|nr:hypothetical protein [Candidatus Parcubacteria bacterium]